MAEHKQFSVAVDVLIFTIEDDALKILLTMRDREPFAGFYALPGVALTEEETLSEAAKRAVCERTGLEGIYLEQLYTFSGMHRDPRSRTIAVAYYALTDRSKLADLQINENVGLFDVKKIFSDDEHLAFDHREMLYRAWERLKGKVNYSDIAFEFVPEKFTLSQLQRVYEIINGGKLYKANFRKMIAPRVEDTGEMLTGNAYRPSKLYRKRTL